MLDAKIPCGFCAAVCHPDAVIHHIYSHNITSWTCECGACGQTLNSFPLPTGQSSCWYAWCHINTLGTACHGAPLKWSSTLTLKRTEMQFFREPEEGSQYVFKTQRNKGRVADPLRDLEKWTLELKNKTVPAVYVLGGIMLTSSLAKKRFSIKQHFLTSYIATFGHAYVDAEWPELTPALSETQTGKMIKEWRTALLPFKLDRFGLGLTKQEPGVWCALCADLHVEECERKEARFAKCRTCSLICKWKDPCACSTGNRTGAVPIKWCDWCGVEADHGQCKKPRSLSVPRDLRLHFTADLSELVTLARRFHNSRTCDCAVCDRLDQKLMGIENPKDIPVKLKCMMAACADVERALYPFPFLYRNLGVAVHMDPGHADWDWHWFTIARICPKTNTIIVGACDGGVIKGLSLVLPNVWKLSGPAADSFKARIVVGLAKSAVKIFLALEQAAVHKKWPDEKWARYMFPRESGPCRRQKDDRADSFFSTVWGPNLRKAFGLSSWDPTKKQPWAWPAPIHLNAIKTYYLMMARTGDQTVALANLTQSLGWANLTVPDGAAEPYVDIFNQSGRASIKAWGWVEPTDAMCWAAVNELTDSDGSSPPPPNKRSRLEIVGGEPTDLVGEELKRALLFCLLKYSLCPDRIESTARWLTLANTAPSPLFNKILRYYNSHSQNRCLPCFKCSTPECKPACPFASKGPRKCFICLAGRHGPWDCTELTHRILTGPVYTLSLRE
ncbi:protein ORF31 [Anguillid herpesvirus 1]|nr:protein ORF31 [Anguillid herpesvirus 1]